MSKRLAGKSVLITGASSGIGRAIARRFAAEGAKLMLADLTMDVREGGTPTLELLRADGYEVDFIQIDVASEDDTVRAVQQTVARYGARDLLLSGWLEGEQVIADRPAVVQVGVGTGRIVLLGFSAQHRAQSHATFRLLFNTIFTSRSR